MQVIHAVSEMVEMRSLYRKAYQAIIKGSLSHGAIGKIAQKIGVSKQYISSVISGAEDYPPSPDFIRDIIEHIPLDPELRIRLRDYMIASYERKRYATDQIQKSTKLRVLDSDVQGLRVAFHNSFYSPSAETVFQSNQIFYEAGRMVALGLSTYDPRQSAEWWLHLAGKSFVLHRPDEGLIFAKRGLELIKPFIDDYSGDDFHLINRIYINLLLMEASAYHHLHWYQESSRLLSDMPRKIRNQGLEMNLWRDLIIREAIPSIIKLPRWSIRSISDQVSKAKHSMEQQGRDFGEFLLIDRSLADAYRVAGKTRQAENILHSYLRIANSDSSTQLDPMRQVMLNRTLANIRWEIGDQTLNGEWSDYIRKTISIAKAHGFEHQISSMKKKYGWIIESML